MFTGLVQHVGTVEAIATSSAGVRWWVAIDSWWPGVNRGIIAGDSICVSGVCLTVAEVDAGNPSQRRIAFDVISETLAKSKLGSVEKGGAVNLEPAVTADQPMGGHFMQGHVDAVGEVTAIQNDPADWRVTIRVPEKFVPWLVPKGSIALDGVSLTLAEVRGQELEVALIPTTLEHTTFDRLEVGEAINLEGDIVVKAVVANLERIHGNVATKPKIDLETLRSAGFA